MTPQVQTPVSPKKKKKKNQEKEQSNQMYA
jgi:hypothetical protein